MWTPFGKDDPFCQKSVTAMNAAMRKAVEQLHAEEDVRDPANEER
jgi:hypothetical protein